LRSINLWDSLYFITEEVQELIDKGEHYMNSKKNYILISILIFSLLVCLIDAVIKPNYFVKIPIKIVFFLIFPILFFIFNKNDTSEFKKLFVFKKKGFLTSIGLGIAVFVVIMGGYLLTKDLIDYSNVTKSLTESMGITADNFIYVAFYIAIINSFLEEFFFRGYGFITLKKYSSRKFAYLFSSGVFAVYHIGMLIGMFNIGALLLLLSGLVAGGCIFNYLNEKNDNIYSSWFVHMFANFAINTVGLILFGIL